jgi:hypothetical protein
MESPRMPQPTDLQALPAVEKMPVSQSRVRGNCCSLQRLAITSMAVVTLISVGIGSYFAGRSQSPLNQEMSQLPLLDAAAAVSDEKYSIATGIVSEEADGFFVLDHNSGLLQCNVIYPRIGGKFMARFSTNVNEAVGTGAKGSKYMMLTGRAQFPRASNRPAAATVVYVMDTASGKYSCFGIPYDRVVANANRPQQGAMILLTTGTANPVIDRDNLR